MMGVKVSNGGTRVDVLEKNDFLPKLLKRKQRNEYWKIYQSPKI